MSNKLREENTKLRSENDHLRDENIELKQQISSLRRSNNENNYGGGDQRLSPAKP